MTDELTSSTVPWIRVTLAATAVKGDSPRSFVDPALPKPKVAVSHGAVRVDHIIIEGREELVVECALVNPVASYEAESRDQRNHVGHRIHRAVDYLPDTVADGERLHERENEGRSGAGAPLPESLAEVGGTLRDVPDVLGRVEEAPDAGGTVDQEAAHFASRAVPLPPEAVDRE